MIEEEDIRYEPIDSTTEILLALIAYRLAIQGFLVPARSRKLERA